MGVGEVRYDDASLAQVAVASFNGSMLGGAEIEVKLDMNSQDGSKVVVKGIPPGLDWQELKDHFGTIGRVAFCDVKGGKGKGKGGKGGFGGGGGGFGGCFGGGFGGGCGGGFGGFGGGGGKGNVLAALGQLLGGMNMNQSMQGCGKAGGKALGGCGKAQQFGGGMMGGFGKGGGKSGIGEVRYDMPMLAQLAVPMLNGSTLNGGRITVTLDHASKDGSKLKVTGIRPGTGWQDLKDHFAAIGQVAFADIK